MDVTRVQMFCFTLVTAVFVALRAITSYAIPEIRNRQTVAPFCVRGHKAQNCSTYHMTTMCGGSAPRTAPTGIVRSKVTRRPSFFTASASR